MSASANEAILRSALTKKKGLVSAPKTWCRVLLIARVGVSSGLKRGTQFFADGRKTLESF